MIAQAQSTQLEKWRTFAQRFHCIDFMLKIDRLPADFTPQHLEQLLEEPISSGEASVSRFLLHAWDRYEHAFDLSSAIGWDRKHLTALAAWVSGEATGEPLHYF